MSHNRYDVKPSDCLDDNFYPEIVADLENIRTSMRTISFHIDPGILISYVKHHSMETKWTREHLAMEKMICCGSLPTKNLEALFASSIGNFPFQNRLEQYISQWFNPAGYTC